MSNEEASHIGPGSDRAWSWTTLLKEYFPSLPPRAERIVRPILLILTVALLVSFAKVLVSISSTKRAPAKRHCRPVPREFASRQL